MKSHQFVNKAFRIGSSYQFILEYLSLICYNGVKLTNIELSLVIFCGVLGDFFNIKYMIYFYNAWLVTLKLWECLFPPHIFLLILNYCMFFDQQTPFSHIG